MNKGWPIGRETSLTDEADRQLLVLQQYYRTADRIRATRYYLGEAAKRLLNEMNSSCKNLDRAPPLSRVECLVVASFYQDAQQAAVAFGDRACATAAHILEQRWLSRADHRKGDIAGWVCWLGRAFWGVTSKYGTSPPRFLTSVLLTILVYSTLYLRTPGVLEPCIPDSCRLEIRDSARVPEAEFSIHDIVSAFYYSVVTLTTLGYGDITPSNSLARLVSASEALLGVCLFGVFVTLLMEVIPKGSFESARSLDLNQQTIEPNDSAVQADNQNPTTTPDVESDIKRPDTMGSNTQSTTHENQTGIEREVMK